MRITIVGEGQWPDRLQRALEAIAQERGDGVSVRVLRPRQLFREVGRADTADVILRVGLRPGATTKRGLAFDVVWALGRLHRCWRREVYYWIGTDVLDSVTKSSAWTRRQLASSARRACHVAAAPWLQEELHMLHIDARLAFFPLDDDVPRIERLPPGKQLRLLTYIPENRWEFYGGPTFVAAARALGSRLLVTIAGRSAEPAGVDAPSNVVFVGWSDQFTRLINESHALARLVQHDALGATVVDALRRRRHVIYTYELPGTIRVPFGDVPEFIHRTSELCAALENGSLHHNDQAEKLIAQRSFRQDATVLYQVLQDSIGRH